MSKKEQSVRKQGEESKISLSSNLNTFFENDLLSVSDNWSIENLIGNQTIIIVVGSQIFPEVFDRVAAYLLQEIINKQGSYQKLQRAIILTDTQYDIQMSLINNDLNEKIVLDSIEYTYGKTYEKNQHVLNIHKLPAISIGGPTVNRVTLDIVKNKSHLYALGGVNISYQESPESTKVALWGNSVLQTQESVLEFIQKKELGLNWFLSKIWNTL